MNCIEDGVSGVQKGVLRRDLEREISNLYLTYSTNPSRITRGLVYEFRRGRNCQRDGHAIGGCPLSAF